MLFSLPERKSVSTLDGGCKFMPYPSCTTAPHVKRCEQTIKETELLPPNGPLERAPGANRTEPLRQLLDEHGRFCFSGTKKALGRS